MRCPFCSNEETKVVDTRATQEGSVIKRRRQCPVCNEKFTTYERIDTIPISVIKNNQTMEAFDREKLIKGMLMSCNKRPVSREQIEKVADEIEQQLVNTMLKEVSSKDIGEMVMQRLKNIDEVSYVRFASVYRQFKDIDSFMDELGRLLKEKN